MDPTIHSTKLTHNPVVTASEALTEEPTNVPTLNPAATTHQPTNLPTSNPTRDPSQLGDTMQPSITATPGPTTSKLSVNTGSSSTSSTQKNEGEANGHESWTKSSTVPPITGNQQATTNASSTDNTTIYLLTAVIALITCCLIGICFIWRKREVKKKEDLIQAGFRANTAVNMSKIDDINTNAHNTTKPAQLNIIGVPSSPTISTNPNTPATVPASIPSRIDPAFEANLNNLMVGNDIMMEDVVDEMNQRKMTAGGDVTPMGLADNDEADMYMDGMETAGAFDDDNTQRAIDTGEDDASSDYYHDEEDAVPETLGQFEDNPQRRELINDNSEEGTYDEDQEDDEIVLDLNQVTVGNHE